MSEGMVHGINVVAGQNMEFNWPDSVSGEELKRLIEENDPYNRDVSYIDDDSYYFRHGQPWVDYCRDVCMEGLGESMGRMEFYIDWELYARDCAYEASGMIWINDAVKYLAL